MRHSSDYFLSTAKHEFSPEILNAVPAETISDLSEAESYEGKKLEKK